MGKHSETTEQKKARNRRLDAEFEQREREQYAARLDLIEQLKAMSTEQRSKKRRAHLLSRG